MEKYKVEIINSGGKIIVFGETTTENEKIISSSYQIHKDDSIDEIKKK